jgi:restriction endonuclease S subunit
MHITLGSISKIQFGFYSPVTESGDVIYLQTKHFDQWGKPLLPFDTFIHSNTKNRGHILAEGDIILAGKGNRNFAWTYTSSIGPAIASSIFFVIKPDINKVLPEYLTTILNLPKTQTYFHTLGAGSSIPSIRKSELEALPLKLPAMAIQHKLKQVNQLHERDIDLSQKIIAEKQKIYQTVINNIINP